jgi:hypothetical protein
MEGKCVQRWSAVLEERGAGREGYDAYKPGHNAVGGSRGKFMGAIGARFDRKIGFQSGRSWRGWNQDG